MTRKYMPMLVPHPCAGALRAIGAVTGSEYVITQTGTWVWLEDLPGLLAERRAVCAAHPLKVQCFFEASASAAQAHPYQPWPGASQQEAAAPAPVHQSPGLGSHAGGSSAEDLPLQLEEAEGKKAKKPNKPTRTPAKEDDE